MAFALPKREYFESDDFGYDLDKDATAIAAVVSLVTGVTVTFYRDAPMSREWEASLEALLPENTTLVAWDFRNETTREY